MTAFRFRKKTDYGLAMLSIIASSKNKYVSVSQMQKRGLPRSFLVKIAQELISAGIIGSKEGRGGGYYLKVNPKTYTLGRVIKVLEGEVAIVDCAVHGKKCPLHDKCPQKKTLIKLNKDISSVLEKYTLSQIC